MRFIDHLLNGYASDADAHWLVDHHEIYVMPMLNPDGHHIVENGAGQPRPQRKNADNDDGCTTFLSLGTDLNRNFPYRWGCCGGSSGSACSETYRGIAANSEEETQAVVAKIRQLIPDQRGPNDTDAAPLTTTGILQSMHSVANLNLYPWGWTNSGAPNNTDLGNIARHMSATNAYPPGNNYQACQPGLCLYNVDGDSFDWQYGELGVPGYTTELHGGSFYPPYSQVEGIYTTNRGQLLYMAKIARTPYLTTRGPDTVSPVTNPMTTTQGTPVNLAATINYNWTANSYLQNVGGAEYYINTPPWAGGSPLPMQAVDGTFDEQNEPVQATIDTTSIPPGTYVVFVRGRGVNDYGGLGSWGPFSATWLVITGGGPTATPTVSCTTGTTDVSIVDFAFDPQVVTIRAGSTIRWTNNGQAPHTSTSTTAVWDSGTLNNGQQFSFTFNTPGSYPYICTIHPSMTGTIVVLSSCATNTVQPTVTRTSTSPPTVTRTPTVPVPSVTRTSTVPPTNTFGVPTFTLTPTRTSTTGPTATGTPPTPTNTVPVPPSATSTVTVPVPPTFTVGIPTATEPAATATPGTPGPSTVTPTVCSITFSDVPPEDTFYAFIRCLACREIIGGYADGTFRPNNNITRGQIAKMVSNSAGFQEPIDGQTYEDVPFGSPFYVFIERLSRRGHMGGYPCGLRDTEPCVPPANRPYFRPNESATRGQLSKIVSNAAGFSEPHTGIFYTDVDENNPFYLEIMRLTTRGVMSGYPCGGINPQTGQPEPCDGQNRPYFRWGNFVTRGQASKIVANTFFPGCEIP
jgi:plastocyanin